MKGEWTVRASDVVYEDEWIIVVNKAYGVPSQPTRDPDRDNVFDAVTRYLARREGKTPYLGLHHRLDALTTGLLLLTKAREANASISAQFQSRRIGKSYCAIGAGSAPVSETYIRPGATWTADGPIGEAPGREQRFMVGGRGRRPARTEILCERAVRFAGGVAGMYACNPLTGRTHQIRVHLAWCGLGIVGDPFYGELPRALRALWPGRMCLHAERLEFEHPMTGERMEVAAPRPEAFVRFFEKIERMSRATTGREFLWGEGASGGRG